jgi:putative redox protein
MVNDMKVSISQIKGISFVGKGDTNHWAPMDGPSKFGGSEAGSRPKELLLIALGGCTGSDVVSILQKKRVSFDSLDINVEAEVSDEIPKVFTKIHVEYVFYGKNVHTQDVERAIELSQEKYCPISNMLSKACPITHSYLIKERKD